MPGIDENTLVYEVKAVQHELADNHIAFRFKVNAPMNISFEIVDRYSSIRTYQESMKKEL